MKSDIWPLSIVVSLSLIVACVDMGSEPEEIPSEENISYIENIQPIFKLN